MANKFKQGDIVVMKSGGPPMTVDKVPGDAEDYGTNLVKEYRCEWFKGATAQRGSFPEHLLKEYEPPKKMTPQLAAEWMLDQFEARRFLYQEEAASHLLHLHDEQLAYHDGNGNACVGKKVLAAFNKLTPEAVYERADKFWRDRLPTDQPGRQQ